MYSNTSKWTTTVHYSDFPNATPKAVKVENVVLHEAVVHLVGMNQKIYFCTVKHYCHFIITYKIFRIAQ